jgi:hypothetical protein
MLHPQDSRRARRAADAHRNRTCHTRRSQTTGAVVAVGLLALAGLSATAPAFAVPSSATSDAAAFAVTGSDAATLSEISEDAQSALGAARAALVVVREITADIAASDLDLGIDDTTIDTMMDTTALREDIDRLSGLDVMPALLLAGMTDDTTAETRRVLTQATQLRGALDAAEAERAAAAAAAEAAAEAAAQAEREAEAAAAAAAALAAGNTPQGAQATARQMASADYGWGDEEFSCLVSLWNKESGWNYQAYNASSGATGIPQALPGSKMASAGADWQTNAATQISWGLQYISAVYGAPCGAWSHSQAVNWY